MQEVVMKKILYFIVVFAAVFAALTLAACGKKDSGTPDDSTNIFSAPYINDFTCDYYTADGEYTDKTAVFTSEDEIKIKIKFNLSSDAYAADKRVFTLKFEPTLDFSCRIVAANSSSTNDEDLTVTYSVDDKKTKKCEVEAKINFYFSSGDLKIAYAYDNEEFTEAFSTPLNNSETLLYTYVAGGYMISKNPDNADWLKNAESLTFPESYNGETVVLFEEEDFFKECVCLKQVTIPNGIRKNYGGGVIMFYNCPIESATIPAWFCTSVPRAVLKRIKVTGDGIIESYAFKNCHSLIKAEVSEDIGGISANAFYGCENLKYNEYGNAYYLGNEKNPYVALVSAKNSEFDEYIVINENTKVICDSAFYRCDYLAPHLTIPDGVRKIGARAFENCRGIKSISIPDGINYIGRYAFAGCENLKYNEYGNAYYLGSKTNPYVALVYCNYNEGSIKINGATKYIYTFMNFNGLTSITIENGIKTVWHNMFEGCNDLAVVTLPEGLTNIEYNAFSRCKSLISINLPHGLTSIGIGAFAGCSSLTSISLPVTLTSIGVGAFIDCDSLTSVTFGGTKKQWLSVAVNVGIEVDEGSITIKCSDGEMKFRFNEK